MPVALNLHNIGKYFLFIKELFFWMLCQPILAFESMAQARIQDFEMGGEFLY